MAHPNDDAHPDLEPECDGNDMSEFDDDNDHAYPEAEDGEDGNFDPPDDEPQDMTDVEADAQALAGAGYGDDESYGFASDVL